jgi:integrase
VQQVRFHDLRHSTASLLLARGVHIKVVAELLGHSTPVLTMATYSHAVGSLAKDAVTDLGGLLVPHPSQTNSNQ